MTEPTAHPVTWFQRDPGGGTLYVKPDTTTDDEPVPYTVESLTADLAAAKAGTATPVTAAELQHLIDAATQHARTCDCPAQRDRHREHSPQSRAELVDETLRHLGVGGAA